VLPISKELAFYRFSLISVLVNKEGKPEDISVVQSLGMGLDEKAVEAARAWTFEPAQKDGKPVAVLINIAMSFRLLKDAGATVRFSPEELRRMADERRRVQGRVYQVRGALPPSVCNQSHQNDTTPLSVPGLTGDPSQYRLRAITFTNNKTLTNREALRKLFPLRDGEPLDLGKLSDGLRSLKQAYGNFGFAAFDAMVQPTIDEKAHLVALEFKCEEGPQFYVDHINVVGLDEPTFEKVKKDLFIKPGDLFNERLVELSMRENSHLTAAGSWAKDRIGYELDDHAATVSITYDFRACIPQ
jgi:TonB family protein